MSEEKKPTEEAPEAISEEPTKQVLTDCPSASSPDGNHDMFHNEGTDETYCRYCGKT